MRRVAIGLCLLFAAVPAVAQPTGKPPDEPAKPAPPAEGSDAATFDAEVAALLGQQGGLTADAAADRAAKTSPEVRRKLAEVAAANAQAAQASLVRVPQV